MFPCRSRLVLPLTLAAFGLVACQPAGTGGEAEPAAESEAASAADTEAATEAAESDAGIAFEVTATEHSFSAPPEIPSGWTNVVLRNEGEEAHFINLWRLPEDKKFGDYTDEVGGAFLGALTPYRAGETSREEMLGQLVGNLPDWYDPIAMGSGGAGLTSPGHTTETWVWLEPGEYVMECYVQTPDDEIHSMLGMMRPLIVTAEDSGLQPPEADMRVTLSNYEITVDGDLTAGEHTVAIDVAEDPEGFLGHDLHLARLDEGTDLDEMASWMDWIDALRTPAPAEFVGGAEQMAAGDTAYLTVSLEPGRYAWISEAYSQQGMVKEFTVE